MVGQLMQGYFGSSRVVQSEDSTTFLSDVSDDDAIYKSSFCAHFFEGGLETIACVKIDASYYISIIYVFGSAHEKFDV